MAKAEISSLNLNLKNHLKTLKEVTSSKKVKVLNGEATIVVTKEKNISTLKRELKPHLPPYQFKRIDEAMVSPLYLEGLKGVIGIVLVPDENPEFLHHEGLLDPSAYSVARDQTGQLYLEMEAKGFTKIHLNGLMLDYDELLGSLLGIELAAYDYKKQAKPLELSASYIGELPKVGIKDALNNAMAIGHAINLSRFLVDTPPSDKRPASYAEGVKKLFDKLPAMTVSIWDEKRLAKENMGCLLGVGQGSTQKPRLVHLRYRPKNGRDMAPLAFVGKGVTFDTGGLNMKPGPGMRYMKKDMGGSACLVGLASWLCDSKSEIPCDIYLAIAENSVDSHSFRPSDILTARNGMTVEIDNTDAEGRLVMADALCVASEAKGKDKPQFLIDVATLTGAIKVGLGDDIGGLFSNNDDLAFILQSCSQISGDLLWRMPLMESQRKKLVSDVADISNSASGFGGAIRAATFLQEFTGDIPWAHLDIYAWNSARQKSFRASGGSGQGVQCLAQFISQL
ncbi:MAG: leucyl aminopeptidase family protein [Bacteriovoracaceae bacterium]|nr:leucyl aminopeptidase family protein [Bacteriovoracaceae bacterium]